MGVWTWVFYYFFLKRDWIDTQRFGWAQMMNEDTDSTISYDWNTLKETLLKILCKTPYGEYSTLLFWRPEKGISI